MFHLNDLMIKKTCGMTEWNKREKKACLSTINTLMTIDIQHIGKYTHTGAHSVEHIEEKEFIGLKAFSVNN